MIFERNNPPVSEQVNLLLRPLRHKDAHNRPRCPVKEASPQHVERYVSIQSLQELKIIAFYNIYR